MKKIWRWLTTGPAIKVTLWIGWLCIYDKPIIPLIDVTFEWTHIPENES